ncbi:FecR family protein [Steroidobacter cummioxidans]|uniref:FecR family protein n=1 Tax=Steroidobacter cummioxidans TaxID=1803913 RepID=UPI000E31B804|nr:FecR domain-containing protein [Steroidobacter cummioxidans]
MDAIERRRRAGKEAAEWWTEMQSADMSLERREAFVEWLRESALHVSEMLHVVEMHDGLAHFKRWSHIGTAGSEQDDDSDTVVEFSSIAARPTASSSRYETTQTDKRHWLQRAPYVAGIAASSLLVLGISLWLSMSGQTIETERGERRELALSDGSVLQVDPETKMRVKLHDSSRRLVILEHGRALFRVAKDPERPFMVRANGTIARAVGTSFAVETQMQDVIVTVAEGKVAVSVPPLPGSDNVEPEIAAMLIADQQLTVGGSGASPSVRKVDSERELAWASGRLVFEHTPLPRVLHEFNRYNRVQMRVDDAELAQRRISGTFNASDPDSFLAFIRTVAKVDVVRDNARNLVITPGG